MTLLSLAVSLLWFNITACAYVGLLLSELNDWRREHPFQLVVCQLRYL